MKSVISGLIFLSALFPYQSKALAAPRVFPDGYLTLEEVQKIDPRLTQKLTEVAQSVIRVQIKDPLGNQIGRATGFVVPGPDHVTIRTAKHVLEPLFTKEGTCDDTKGSITISSADESRSENLNCSAIWKTEDPTLVGDTAILNLNGDWKPIDLHFPAKLTGREEVIALGFPKLFNGGMVASLGHIMVPMGGTAGKEMAITASVSPGMSGGIVLEITRDGRLFFLGHLIQQMNNSKIASVPVRYKWGTPSLKKKDVCLDLAELNDIFYRGSISEVVRKTRLMAATKYILQRADCETPDWKWNNRIIENLERYRTFLQTYLERETENVSELHQSFDEDYIKLIESDEMAEMKFSDLPLSPIGSDETVSLEEYRNALRASLKQLNAFQEKLTRIQKLFPKSKKLSDWLLAIENLDLKNNLKALNDHILFGPGVVRLW